MDVEREWCAAGRTLKRDDMLDGLNWAQPCENYATDDLLDLGEHGRFPLCELHKRPIFDGLYDRLVKPEDPWIVGTLPKLDDEGQT